MRVLQADGPSRPTMRILQQKICPIHTRERRSISTVNEPAQTQFHENRG